MNRFGTGKGKLTATEWKDDENRSGEKFVLSYFQWIPYILIIQVLKVQSKLTIFKKHPPPPIYSLIYIYIYIYMIGPCFLPSETNMGSP